MVLVKAALSAKDGDQEEEGLQKVVLAEISVNQMAVVIKATHDADTFVEENQWLAVSKLSIFKAGGRPRK